MARRTYDDDAAAAWQPLFDDDVALFDESVLRRPGGIRIGILTDVKCINRGAVWRVFAAISGGDAPPPRQHCAIFSKFYDLFDGKAVTEFILADVLRALRVADVPLTVVYDDVPISRCGEAGLLPRAIRDAARWHTIVWVANYCPGSRAYMLKDAQMDVVIEDAGFDDPWDVQVREPAGGYRTEIWPPSNLAWCRPSLFCHLDPSIFAHLEPLPDAGPVHHGSTATTTVIDALTGDVIMSHRWRAAARGPWQGLRRAFCVYVLLASAGAGGGTPG